MHFPFVESKEGLILNLDVVPNADGFRIVGINEWNNSLKVKVKAPPKKGRANEEIIKEFSRRFCSKAEILSGKFGHKKKILLQGNSKEIAGKIISTCNKL